MVEFIKQIGDFFGYDGRVALMSALVSVLISGLIAWFLARRYGDIAGTQAAIDFEKQKETEAYQTALTALLNQVKVAKEIAIRNSTLDGKHVQPVVKLPTTAFETAFLIGKESLMAKTQLNRIRDSGDVDEKDEFNHIFEYLSEAYSINTLIDMYINLVGVLASHQEGRRDEALAKLKARSEKIVKVLDKIYLQLLLDLRGHNIFFRDCCGKRF